MKERLDKKKGGAAKGPAATATNAAFSKFQQATRVGAPAADKPAGEVKAETTHQNAVSCISLIKSAGKITEFSTSGYDGRLVRWSVADIEKEFGGLKI